MVAVIAIVVLFGIWLFGVIYFEQEIGVDRVHDSLLSELVDPEDIEEERKRRS